LFKGLGFNPPDDRYIDIGLQRHETAAQARGRYALLAAERLTHRLALDAGRVLEDAATICGLSVFCSCGVASLPSAPPFVAGRSCRGKTRDQVNLQSSQ